MTYLNGRTGIAAMGGGLCDAAISDLSASEVYQTIAHLERDYPDLKAWYYGKVIPGLQHGNRRVIACVAHKQIVGVAIAKRGEERKLSTLWVAPYARGMGIAADLASEAFDWIGTTKPLFTVPERRLQEFRGLLKQWDFDQSSKLLSYYQSGSVEHIFNGKLTPALSS